MSGAQNPIITKFVFFHKICDAKRTQRDHTFFGPRANMFQKTIFFRAPSKHVLKVKIKNTVSLEGNTISAKGNTVSAKGNTTSAKGNTVSAKGNTISAKGNTVSAKGNTVSAKGNVFLSSERGLAMQ